MATNKVVGIGWDVGGWMGGNHGLAAAIWENDTIRWIGKPRNAAIPQKGLFTLDDFLLGYYSSSDILQQATVVVAIDAPLGYPADCELSGVNVFLKDDWKQMIEFMTDRMIRIEQAFKKSIERIRKE